MITANHGRRVPSEGAELAVTATFRTPEERFDGLPDFGYEPHYRFVRGMRLAHLDVGEGPPVVMLHGEPAWSFVWRSMIPPLRDAGFRCVAPDHAGFGRSDKPVDPAWQTLGRHVELTSSLLDELDLRNVTLVVHDWGGPIGLTLAMAHPGRVARIVVLDTVLDPRELWISERWVRFREFVEQTADMSVGELMRATCFHHPGDRVTAGYEAPFPTVESKAAMRGLPMSVPRSDDEPALAAADALCAAVRNDPRPILTLWGERDLILTLASGQRLASRIGRRIDHVIPEAGHGLQEDQGPMIANLIAEWLESGA
jgi:haloalkane dehalogenase